MKWKRLYLDSSSLPAREIGNAGFDLPSYESVIIPAGESRTVGTGLAFEIPAGWVGLIVGRSGLRFKHRVHADDVGVIDENYRGEVKILVVNDGHLPLVIEPRDRIAQMLLVPYYDEDVKEVSELSDSSRGDKGFGSTGIGELLWK